MYDYDMIGNDALLYGQSGGILYDMRVGFF